MGTGRRLRLHAKAAVTLLVAVILLAGPLLLCLLAGWVVMFFAVLLPLVVVIVPVAVLTSVVFPHSELQWLSTLFSEHSSVTALAGFSLGLFLAWVDQTSGASDPEDSDVLESVVTARATPSEQPVLCGLVPSVTQRLDSPEPEVLVAGPDAPPALTVGQSPKRTVLVVSTGTLDALTPDELEAVVAHELAHAKHRDSAVKELLLLPLDVLVVSGTMWVHFVLFLAPFLVAYYLAVDLATSAFSRTREVAADRASARVTGNPAALASALETLDEHSVERPATDAREGTVSALAIVPSTDEYAVRTDWNRRPLFWSVQKPLRRQYARLSAKHPRTEDRIDALRAIEREQETA